MRCWIINAAGELITFQGTTVDVGARLDDDKTKEDNSVMARLTGPDFITLLVRDVEVSRRFYTEILEFPLSPERRPNAVAFATQPIPFAVRKSPMELDVKQLGHGIILWVRADDSVAIHRRLKEHGVAIVNDLADSPFGKTFTFRDPDGHLFTVHDGG
jgi:catechol 2,3-dioxygenase-like lactoylglutathione lyase family enzyme